MLYGRYIELVNGVIDQLTQNWWALPCTWISHVHTFLGLRLLVNCSGAQFAVLFKIGAMVGWKAILSKNISLNMGWWS